VSGAQGVTVGVQFSGGRSRPEPHRAKHGGGGVSPCGWYDEDCRPLSTHRMEAVEQKVRLPWSGVECVQLLTINSQKLA
jgi:hypothetical protein